VERCIKGNPQCLGLVLQSCQKLTLSLLATITLKAVLLCAYALFPVLLPFFKCILEVVFCESVLHCLRLCLDHISCVKIAAFQLYLQSGNQRKVGWVGDDSHVVFYQKFPGEKGSVSLVCCGDTTANSLVTKVQGEVFTHFHAVTVQYHRSMQN
jgi:hypothetical protein